MSKCKWLDYYNTQTNHPSGHFFFFFFFLSKATTDNLATFTGVIGDFFGVWRLWLESTYHSAVTMLIEQQGAAMSPSPVQKHSRAVSLSRSREETHTLRVQAANESRMRMAAHGCKCTANKSRFQLTAGSPLNVHILINNPRFQINAGSNSFFFFFF